MKKENRGSTLITVVVGVSFLMILAAILLSGSSAGLRMKQMEYAAKKHHYSDEQILNDVYNGIGKVAAECMTKAYTQVLSQVADTAHPVYTQQEDAYRAFSHQFMALFEKGYWPEVKDKNTPEDLASYNATLAKLNAYITVPPEEAELTGFSKSEIITDKDGVPYRYAFRDVTVRYQTVDAKGVANGYEAVITTDIVVEIPYINFFRDSSRILDYAMIGNQGIYFKGSSNRSVEGSLYAGIGESADPDSLLYRDETVPGGLNFYQCGKVEINGPYLVSKGDINVRESEVIIGNTASAASAQVWVESIRTVENGDKSEAAKLAELVAADEKLAQLTLSASVYAANDLELNARKSKITLNGEYYGYGNGVYETQEKKSVESRTEDRYTSTAHTNNSAIIINGNQSELDLSGLHTLVVAGNAYVDLSSRAYLDNPPAGSTTRVLEEFKTGESLALKSNQYIYLAPTSCLKTTNPVKKTEALSAEEVWQAESNWFGLAGGFVDASHPVTAKSVEHAGTGKEYIYYYLNLLPGMEKKYAATVLHMIDPVNNLADMDAEIKSAYDYGSYNTLQWNQIWELKQSAAKRAAAAQVQAVVVAEDTTASIYAEGVLSKVTAAGLENQEIAEPNRLSLETMSKLKSKMHLRYEWMYADLDPKEEFSLASDLLRSPFAPEGTIDQTDTRLPASQFVAFDKLPIGAGVVETTYKYQENKNYKTVLSGAGYTVPAGTSFQGIIISRGDVLIPSGTDIEGLIIAGGRIKVEGNGVIRANRSIVQSILDEEMTEESKKNSGTVSRSDYASYVLKGFNPSQSYTAQDLKYRVTGTEYTDYISFENWRKGEGN